MPTPAGPPLRKVTLNLYEEDYAAAEKLYGHGWSSVLRQIWHEHVYSRSNRGFDPKRLTLGDLDEKAHNDETFEARSESDLG